MTAELRALTNLARAASAGTPGVEPLLGRMCASIAETFGFERIDAYRHVEDDQVLLLSGVGVLRPLAERPLFRRALAAGEPVFAGGEIVAPLPAADGVVGFLAASTDATPSPERLDLLGACAAIVAVSLQRALEHEELERLGKLKSGFIALASHELRTPAAVVHGIAKTIELRADELDPERLRELHRTLVQHTDRLTRLIDELLDLSRLEASGVEIAPEPVRVRELVEEVVAGVGADAPAEISIEVDGGLSASVDRTALERILANLVTNALRYGGGSRVSIRAQQHDRHFRLTVEDNGAGVAPGFVPHLFERFTRADGATSKVGAGLGLSIAQSYAQAHGGQLFYEDAEPSGARFQLVLPSPH